jgi:hypothetical protein
MTDNGFIQFGRTRVVDFDFGFSEDLTSQVVADCAVYISTDGNRRAEHLLNVTHKKCRIGPKHLQDAFAQWIPVDDMAGFEEDDADLVSSVPTALTSSAKRKYYTSSVRRY